MSIWTRKSLDRIHSEAEAGTLHRVLGPVHLTALGIGAIIGAGIFVLTGQAAAMYAGPAITISFILELGHVLSTRQNMSWPAVATLPWY